jgi:hypothetical protein
LHIATTNGHMGFPRPQSFVHIQEAINPLDVEVAGMWKHKIDHLVPQLLRKPPLVITGTQPTSTQQHATVQYERWTCRWWT